MARQNDLEIFAKKFDLHMLNINDIIIFRSIFEDHLVCLQSKEFCFYNKKFIANIFKDENEKYEYYLISSNTINKDDVCTVSFHQENIFNDIFFIKGQHFTHSGYQSKKYKN